MSDVGYYTLPVIASFEGIDNQVNKTLGSKFGVAGKKAGKDFSKGAGDGLKALQRDVDETAKSYQKMRDKAEDSLGKIRSEEEKLKKLRDSKASNERIVASEERLAKARRDSGRATRDAGDSYKVLQKAQKALSDESGRTGSIFEGLGPKVASFGTLAAGAAVGGIALLAAGAAKVTRELYDLGAQFDDMSDNLRVKTGVSGAGLDALTKSVENISKSTPSSLAAIGNVVAETTRALHLTGPELESMSKNIANLNRLTGEDTDVKALGQAFRGFGIDAKDQVPALNSLFQTYQKTGIGINELVASVVKGGPQLREFGFDLGSSAGLLSEFEQAGLDGDKALSALTKGLAQFAKDGKEPKKALADTVNEVQRLISIGDQAGAQNLTNKIFGAKAGLQIFEGIQSGALDVKQLQETLASTGDTIQKASDDTADWAEKWQTLKNQAAVALQPLASNVFEGINGGLTELSDWVAAHPAEIIQGFGGIAEAFLKTGAAIGQFVAGALHVLAAFQEVTGRVVGATADALGGLLNGIGHLVGIFDNDLGKSIDDAGNKLHAFADTQYKSADALNALASKISTASDGVWQFGTNVGTAADKAAGAQREVDLLGSTLLGMSKFNNIPIDIKVNAIPGAGVALSAVGGITIPIATALTGSSVAPGAGTPGNNPLLSPYGRAKGGVLPGYSPGVDNMLVPMSGGEGVIVPPVMKQLGPAWLARLNAGGGYAGGGIVGLDALYSEAQSLQGTKYSMSAGDDCSGTMSQLVNAALGLDPKADRMSTMTAAKWLAGKGALPGVGPAGTFRMGWKNGGPGGGHMAGTLPDGTNVEMGGANGGYTLGGSAKGADDPSFTDHAYLPIEALYPDGMASGSVQSPYGAGSTSGGSYSAPDQKAVREAQQKVSDADSRVSQAEQKQKELKADAKQSEKDKAQTDLDKAKREAKDARTDLDTVMKGKFTPGKAGKSSGQGGLGQFGELGGIAGSFLKETFGIDGSFLPDLSSLGIVQAGGTLLNAFKGPLQGLVDGGLGIQQPGWSPGMPVNGVEAPSLFGATQMPGLPDPAQPGGGPAGPVSIDNSQHITSTGDPVDVENRVRRANMNRPRINTYAPLGIS